MANPHTHQLWNGTSVVCDPELPIEHDCRVLAVFRPASTAPTASRLRVLAELLVLGPNAPSVGVNVPSDVTLEGICLTKHPRKAKTGIGISYADEDGNSRQIWGCSISGAKRNVYRIVG